ncbi:MAG TPA: response regulator transcription factor [Tepidisphaeraceae bacterium]|jgi:DNA-binding response OmpR family regulator
MEERAPASGRILVAEDHPSLARSIAEGLREEGFEVDLVLDGLEADRLLSTQRYDCVALDIILPGKDGYTILREMRQKGNRTPVLCVTARDALDDRVQGLNLGADDYLIKPFAWDELLARVKALIRRERGYPQPKLVIADLEIDNVAKSVKRGGHEVHLTAREFMLLQFLCARQNQVVSREEIWKHLYGQSDEASSNVVDVYIRYLRNKIDKDHPLKLIHTRRGMGYMITSTPMPEHSTT